MQGIEGSLKRLNRLQLKWKRILLFDFFVQPGLNSSWQGWSSGFVRFYSWDKFRKLKNNDSHKPRYKIISLTSLTYPLVRKGNKPRLKGKNHADVPVGPCPTRWWRPIFPLGTLIFSWWRPNISIRGFKIMV